MKEYVSLAIAAMEIGKISALPRGFLKIFTSGWYHRDMKFLKILTSKSKRFRFHGIFKKIQFGNIGGSSQILKFS